MTTETKLPPTHPGETLNEEFLRPMNITQCRLAKAIGVGPFANSWDCGLAGWWWGSC